MNAEEASIVLRELLGLAERITARAEQVLAENNPSAADGLLWASSRIYDRITEIKSRLDLP